MSHPHLSYLYNLYQSEEQPFRKVHRMIDLFESIIKTHTVVIIAEYVQHNQLSDTAKGLLAQGLRTPSLGTWQLFSRVLFEELQALNYAWTLSEFASGFEFLDKSLNSDKTNVIAFRNGYAHGATPSDEQCENDIRKFEPYLEKLLNLSWIEQSSIAVNDGIVYIQSEAHSLSCHPIFLFRDENNEASFAFFNDLKNDRIGLLNYPLGKHYREKEFFKVFHEYLPLNEWKKSGNNEFYQRIEELTETFKGRTFEREKLLQFVINETKGYCSIQGNPGIGKSALIAQFFKDLRASDKAKNVNVVEYFIRRGTAQAQTEYLLNYLIKRTDEVFPQGKEVRAEGKMVFEIQQQLFNKWRMWSEHSNGKKLLFLIDGLDEGVENNIVSYLPRENFHDILIIYGSRPGGHKTIDELWSTLPLESHGKIELSGLSKEDIRALIYEVANKYDLEKDSEWIEAVQKRSQGNPLYLKLLCDSIENGGMALNDLNALPSKIDDYYKAILLRYAQDPDGDALLAGLYTFAAAKDYLTMSHLGLINQLGDATLERIGSTLKEVLYENPLTEEVLDYQLFHESFREYLINEKSLKVSEAKQRIIECCGRWKEFEGQWEQRYVLEHYASHLHESIKDHHADLLLKLIYDTDFQTTQKRVLRGFEATNTLFRLALLKASDIKRFDEQLEAGLCLVDLKYEEANDAPQIVTMVANGEIDLALKRIESFGASDKEGIQRKFILYMLCLMELTLLESKDKPFRKEGIEKLLNHLDEQIPADTSLINWNDFFPSNLMFEMAFEWAEIGLEYLIVYARTDGWEYQWVKRKGHYSKKQFEVLVECTRVISDLYNKRKVVEEISAQLIKQDETDYAFECVQFILDRKDYSIALNHISSELAIRGNYDKALVVLNQALESAREIKDDSDRIFAFLNISNEFYRQRDQNEASLVLNEAIECARNIRIDSSQDYNNSLSNALRAISNQLFAQGEIAEALVLLHESFRLALLISEEYFKSSTLRDISSEFYKQGFIVEAGKAIQEAVYCARCTTDEFWRAVFLKDVFLELHAQGQLIESYSVFQEVFDFAIKLPIDSIKSNALKHISFALSELGNFKDAIKCAREISCLDDKIDALTIISIKLANKGIHDQSSALMREAVECSSRVSNESLRSSVLTDITFKLLEQEKLEEAIEFSNFIDDFKNFKIAIKGITSKVIDQGNTALASGMFQRLLLRIPRFLQRSNALCSISKELARQGRIDAAFICAQTKLDEVERCLILKSISDEFFKNGFLETAAVALEKSFECAKSLTVRFHKSQILLDISSEFAKRGDILKALECTNSIDTDEEINWVKSYSLVAIFSEMTKIGMEKEAYLLYLEALSSMRQISNESDRCVSFQYFSNELFKLGKFKESAAIETEAFGHARSINSDRIRSKVLAKISFKLYEQGRNHEAQAILFEALEIAKCLNEDWEKNIAFSFLSEGFVDVKMLKEAIECARGIKDIQMFGRTLKYISLKLAEYGDLSDAESICLEISSIGVRQSCWKSIAANFKKANSNFGALEIVKRFQSEEAQVFFIKGWSESVLPQESDINCIQESLSILFNDSDSLEALLQTYAVHEVFFGGANQKKLNRLNRTLNIQWALDIAAQFPKEGSATRLSTNLESWLHEIADEDDREQIELWAKQVGKGKISEEEFAVNIKVYK